MPSKQKIEKNYFSLFSELTGALVMVKPGEDCWGCVNQRTLIREMIVRRHLDWALHRYLLTHHDSGKYNNMIQTRRVQPPHHDTMWYLTNTLQSPGIENCFTMFILAFDQDFDRSEDKIRYELETQICCLISQPSLWSSWVIMLRVYFIVDKSFSEEKKQNEFGQDFKWFKSAFAFTWNRKITTTLDAVAEFTGVCKYLIVSRGLVQISAFKFCCAIVY